MKFLNNIKTLNFEEVVYANNDKYTIHNFGIQGFLGKIT